MFMFFKSGNSEDENVTRHMAKIYHFFIISLDKRVLIMSLLRMNLDWKWPVGFTPLTGSRSMVNLHQPEETATPETLPRSESSMALVEMREGTSPHPDNDKVKLEEKEYSMSSTYYQCRGGGTLTSETKLWSWRIQGSWDTWWGEKSVEWVVLNKKMGYWKCALWAPGF